MAMPPLQPIAKTDKGPRQAEKDQSQPDENKIHHGPPSSFLWGQCDILRLRADTNTRPWEIRFDDKPLTTEFKLRKYKDFVRLLD
jgi:hypothetical protein